MKRVIIAFSMLSFAVLIAVFSAVILNKNIARISEDIKNLYTKADTVETTEITDEANEIITKWNKTEKVLKLITVSDKLSYLSESIHSLNHITQSGDKEKLKEKCQEISVMLNAFLSSEETAVENIF